MNEQLRAELLMMLQEDQAARQAVYQMAEHDPEFRIELERRTDPETSEIGVIEWGKDFTPLIIEALLEVDQRHLTRLREIVQQHGWPSCQLVGGDGADAAWLLVLHADRDRAFQRDCLELLMQATEIGEADPRQMAWLTDRLCMAERKEQVFGTILIRQDGKTVPFRLVDPTTVNERRSAVGLLPLEDDIEQDMAGHSRLPMQSWQ